MSYGPDNIITEAIARLIPEENRGSYVAEEILDALEEQDYRIVHKSQVLPGLNWRFAKIPKGYVIHHIDGNRNNHQLDNLRLVKLEGR